MTTSTGIALIAQTGQSDCYDLPHVRFPGLDDGASYRVRLLKPWPKMAARSVAQPEKWEDGITLTGRSLAQSGISLPLSQPETAWLLLLERL